jgi:cellulose synthase (UDP-forming)
MFIPLSWLVQYFVRMAILIVPAIYLWTGVAPLYFTGMLDIVWYQVPVLVAYFFLMVWLTPSRYLPIVSSAVGAFSTFRMLPTVVASIVKPFGTPFKVTPKGSGNESSTFDVYTFTCIAVLIGVTALGLFVNVVPEWSQIGQGEFSIVSAYWAGVNIVVLVIASLICFEKPKPLLDSFQADEAALLSAGGLLCDGRLTSVSLDRAVLECPSDAAPKPGPVTLKVHDVSPFNARVEHVDNRPGRSAAVWLSFILEGEARDEMIVKLYTGRYSQDIRVIDKSAIVGGLWSRAFGSSTPAARDGEKQLRQAP